MNSFQLKTVTFGVNSAPFLAIRTLLELGHDSRQIYPKASIILRNEVNVDDILSDGYTLDESKMKQVERTLEICWISLEKDDCYPVST